MRAAVVSALGSPPGPAEAPAPARGQGEALVAVGMAPLNPIEIRIAAGRFARTAEPPYVPGTEGVGRVVEANGRPSGGRVRFEGALPGFGANGALAELAAVPEDALVELPDEADDALAAAIGTVGITAWLALERAGLRPGERVLVLGATGAVGQAAVQLARVLGAGHVAAAGRDAERLDRARELGADEVVDLARDDLADAFRAAAGGEIDVVVDPLWGPPAMAALAALGNGGRLVNVGESAGTGVHVPLGGLRNKQGAILTLSSGWTPLPQKLAAYRRVLEHALAGRLEVDREVVPLAEVAAAWERQAGSPGRKLVIDVGAA
jgi:NADPH:quinone reductase